MAILSHCNFNSFSLGKQVTWQVLDLFSLYTRVFKVRDFSIFLNLLFLLEGNFQDLGECIRNTESLIYGTAKAAIETTFTDNTEKHRNCVLFIGLGRAVAWSFNKINELLFADLQKGSWNIRKCTYCSKLNIWSQEILQKVMYSKVCHLVIAHLKRFYI